MQRKDPRKILRIFWIVLAPFCLVSASAYGQQGTAPVPGSASGGVSSTDTSQDIRALTELVGKLQTQVQALSEQLTDVRSELDLVRAQVPPKADPGSQVYSTAAAVRALTDSGNATPTAVPQDATDSDRIAKLEENQEIVEAKVDDQYQTKVESGSKYRLRLSGMVLLNLYDNRGSVDNQDFPQFSVPPQTQTLGLYSSSNTFGGSLRQSQIKLQAFGPDIAGARTSADLEVDFGGGSPAQWNGAVLGLVRLRTGTMRLDWANTSIVAGQDHLFFAPLAPTSLASMAIPALSYSGNLWAWTPQVRVEHRIKLSDASNIQLQAGILDSLTGDFPVSGNNRLPSWGEESGQPAYAVRVAWSHKMFGQDFTVGTGGYYGRQDWGFNRTVDGWAGTVDLTLPLGTKFEITSAFYRGRAVAGLGGGIGQSVLLNGEFMDPATTFRALDSIGGWAQLKFKATPRLQINGALGIDNPYAGEMRRYQSNSIYFPLYTRNLSPLVNFIYQLRSNILISTEYHWIDTSVLDSNSNSANHIDLTLGYIF